MTRITFIELFQRFVCVCVVCMANNALQWPVLRDWHGTLGRSCSRAERLGNLRSCRSDLPSFRKSTLSLLFSCTLVYACTIYRLLYASCAGKSLPNLRLSLPADMLSFPKLSSLAERPQRALDLLNVLFPVLLSCLSELDPLCLCQRSLASPPAFLRLCRLHHRSVVTVVV